eukprot:8018093-Prorocentrum_lima.AAC.1
MQRRASPFGGAAYGAAFSREILGMGCADGGGEVGHTPCFRYPRQMGCDRVVAHHATPVFAFCCSADVPRWISTLRVRNPDNRHFSCFGGYPARLSPFRSSL